MKIALLKFGGGTAGKVEVADSFVARPFNSALAHQAVVANLANARQGTRAQKTRAEVSHSTRKLFRQKGSGRARGGMSSSPIRRGGGRAFPARPDENFSHKMPRRMFRTAMAVMLSQLLREERLVAVKELKMKAPKTADLAARLQKMNIGGRRIFLVDSEEEREVALSARNLPNIYYGLQRNLTPADLAAADLLVITERALLAAAETWSGDGDDNKKLAPPLDEFKKQILALLKKEKDGLQAADILRRLDGDERLARKALTALQNEGGLSSAKQDGRRLWSIAKEGGK